MNFYYPLDINQQKIKISQTTPSQHMISTILKKPNITTKALTHNKHPSTLNNMQIECAKE
jgi:hypothetical protein